eukprot:CAMPEP_0172860300 /NCGR_PEP_ID=MMETSP1075-20121228/72003_1 /TAXON_ID=2916 /ORGANISM="Ceratium fusus, Strain PA161109" /LENGTH=123 /DNA_ID=CAMNT_0013708305 /DNA_START=347 /DNA_END=715 /DNA_ORIENTATION=-
MAGEWTVEMSVGQEVDVRIDLCDLEKGRLSLTGWPCPPETVIPVADLSAFEGILPDQWLTGKVARVSEFGAFVTVWTPDGKATAEGLVHSTQIKDSHVSSVKKELQRDQVVQVRLQALDVMGG